MLALMVFGWISYQQLGISQLPDVDFPVVSINVALEGAAPEVMESEVADVIEDAVMSVQGIQEVSSVSRQGNASIKVEFSLDKNIDVAIQEIQTKISQAQRNLPKDIDPPIVSKTNPEDQPIMWIALSGDKPLKDLIEYAKNHLKDRFTTVPGVGEVLLGGYIEPNLRVWIDNQKLKSRELTVLDVVSAIGRQHAELPAGRIENAQQELNVRIMGEANTVAEFQRIIIPARNGAPIWKSFRIEDLGYVEDGLNDIRRISRSMQKPAVGLGIKKQRGMNAVAVAASVKAQLADLQKSLPQGLSLAVNFDSTVFTKEASHELTSTLIWSAILTSLVCWLFLGSLSSAFNIVLAIPTSILGTFIFMNFMGFTLNTFTLLGLSLVIGIVVDDAIMVLENIVRHRERGEPKVKAAIMGAREIAFPAMATSVAILAIFVPVVFMKGIMGKFFFQFGFTISVAVLISLLEALTLAPMRCSQFLQVGATNWVARGMDRFLSSLTKGYQGLLEKCLCHRGWVLGISLVIFLASTQVVHLLKKEFVPSQDQSRFMVRLQTPLGSSIEFTDAAFKKAEAEILKIPEVKRYFAAVGGFGGGEVNSGVMFVTLKEMHERKLTQQQLIHKTRAQLKKIPGFEKVIVQDLSLSGFTAQRGFPVEFTLRGENWDKLGELSETFRKKLEQSGLVQDVDTDYLLGMPEVRVVPNREQAALRGVDINTIGTVINATIGGVRVGKYSRDGKRYDIRLRLMPGNRKQPRDISQVTVRNVYGEVVPLSELVSIVEKPTLLSISRKNRERAISVFANIAQGRSQQEALAAVEQVAKQVLPENYRMVFSGSAQTFKESFASLTAALVLGIFVAYMILGSQFNSFMHPVLVLLALPFSITGAFLGLALTGQSLNLYSMIGILLLMGIVKKNSILLVDFTNERRKQGLSVQAALLEACPIRFRPILMTSVATIAAAVPPALAMGPGFETRIPMAVVIIGGVFVSTFLTLFVVPCAYSLAARFESHRHEKDLHEALVELGELPA